MKYLIQLVGLAFLFAGVGCKTAGGGRTEVKTYTVGDDKDPTDGKIYWSPIGETVTVRETIIVKAGETFDGRQAGGLLKRFKAGPELGDGSQREGQKAIFEIEPGGRLRYVIIDHPGADGVHVDAGNAKDKVEILGVEWRDVGEDALTVKDGDGLVLIKKCKFAYAADKSIQLSSRTGSQVKAIDCQWFKCQKGVRSGNADSPMQWMEVNGGSARDVDFFWYGNHPQARGRIRNGFKLYGDGQLVVAKNGASVKVD